MEKAGFVRAPPEGLKGSASGRGRNPARRISKTSLREQKGLAGRCASSRVVVRAGGICGAQG